MSTKKHVKSIECHQNSQKLDKLLYKAEEEKTIKHADVVSCAELKLCAFIAEHNVAFSNVDHLCPLLSSIFEDSKINKDIKLNRTKCTQIIKNVIGKFEVDEIIERLRNSNFSVLVDESTDVNMNKILCAVVEYVSEAGFLRTNLLQLINLDAQIAQQ